MARTIILAATLPASPEMLYDMYLDADAHAAFTGAEVKLEPRPGGAFSAFGGVLSGKFVEVQSRKLIVQTWRSAHWQSDALDSILVLTFFHDPAGGRIELVQVNVPEEDFAGVSMGWNQYYWTPWRDYLGSVAKRTDP